MTGYDAGTSLPLYVSDPSMHLPVFFTPPVMAGASPPPIDNVSGGVQITGHFDDPASADCRAPANEMDGLSLGMTDASAILFCRSRFIVTSAETGAEGDPRPALAGQRAGGANGGLYTSSMSGDPTPADRPVDEVDDHGSRVAGGRPATARLVALLGPDPTDEDIDDFVAALKAATTKPA